MGKESCAVAQVGPAVRENTGGDSPPVRADIWLQSLYIVDMDSKRLALNEALTAEYHSRWEAVERFKAQELAGMSEERGRQIIQSLAAVEGWRERTDWSGLVEQQAIFRKTVRP